MGKIAGMCFLLLVLVVFSVTPISNAATEEEIETSIAPGLAWLASVQNPDGSWGIGCDRVGVTGLVVLKFETRAIELGIDPFDEGYEYHNEVANGLAYILANTHTQTIGPQPAGDPDGDGDGIGMYFNNCPGVQDIYNTGIAMMAIAASGHPETYSETLQDALDYVAWAQADEGCDPDDLDRGGWSFGANSCPGNPVTDNSNTGCVTLGLGFAAAAPPYGFALTVPQFVKDELSIWIDVIQDKVDGDLNDGGSWYRPNLNWVNIMWTGNLLYEMAFVGDNTATQRVQDAVEYIERHWADPGVAFYDTGWRDRRQAMFTMMKGFEAFGIQEIDSDDDGQVNDDWFGEVSTHLVATQNPDGSWPEEPLGDQILSTAWALLTLERAVPAIEKIPVPVDIKPQSCPNPLNVGSKGVLPVAILGTENFDVTQIDPDSIELTLNENGESVTPLRCAYEDVAAPFEPFTGKEGCYDCNELGPDGHLDLTLKFDRQEVVGILRSVEDGDCIVLSLMGNLLEEYDSTPFFGQDVVRILKKK